MVQLHPLRRALPPRSPALLPLQHLVNRVGPAVSPAGVDLLNPEHSALGAVGVEVPGIAVDRLGGPVRPGRLQRRPPARVKHLIQIGTHTDVRVLRYQLQRAVAGRVKPPGLHPLFHNHRPQGTQALRGPVGGAGVQHIHPVCLRHGGHPALCISGLVFANGINHNLHKAIPLIGTPRAAAAPPAAFFLVPVLRSPAARPPAGFPEAG